MGVQWANPRPDVARVTEGDLVRVRFTNKHTSNHTLHFHGLNVPNEMDGVAYGHLNHLEVKPGETHTYEFVADPAGTHMYHCHVNSPQHIDMGMVGVLIVEPKDKRSEPNSIRKPFFSSMIGTSMSMAIRSRWLTLR